MEYDGFEDYTVYSCGNQVNAKEYVGLEVQRICVELGGKVELTKKKILFKNKLIKYDKIRTRKTIQLLCDLAEKSELKSPNG